MPWQQQTNKQTFRTKSQHMALLEDQPFFFKIWMNEILPNNCTVSYNVDIESNTLPLYLQVYTEFILCSSILLELPILRIVRLNVKRFFFVFPNNGSNSNFIVQIENEKFDSEGIVE